MLWFKKIITIFKNSPVFKKILKIGKKLFKNYFKFQLSQSKKNMEKFTKIRCGLNK